MKRNLIYRTSISAIVIFLLILSLSGCRTTGRIHIGNTLPEPGPAFNDGTPPWAPAHGYNAKYHYRYYPYHGVYTVAVKTEAKATRSGYINKKSSRDKEDDEDGDKENDARRAVTRDSLISH